MAFITDEQLKAYYAAQLRHSDGSAALTASYDVLAPIANLAAYNKILSKLVDRGYTVAQIATWDRRAEFNYKLGCWELFLTGASLQADDTWPEKFNVESQLETVTLLAGGVLIEIDTSDADISYGVMTFNSNVSATFIGGDAE